MVRIYFRCKSSISGKIIRPGTRIELNEGDPDFHFIQAKHIDKLEFTGDEKHALIKSGYCHISDPRVDTIVLRGNHAINTFVDMNNAGLFGV